MSTLYIMQSSLIHIVVWVYILHIKDCPNNSALTAFYISRQYINCLRTAIKTKKNVLETWCYSLFWCYNSIHVGTPYLLNAPSYCHEFNVANLHYQSKLFQMENFEYRNIKLGIRNTGTNQNSNHSLECLTIYQVCQHELI